MNEHLVDRKEPLVEVNPEGEENFSPRSFRRPRRSFPLIKWVLVPIILIGAFGLGFGLWMILPSGMLPGKKQPEVSELSVFKGEVQQLKSEIDRLKKEIQFMKEEMAAFQGRTKILQEQNATLKDQLSVLENKKDLKGNKKPESKKIVYKVRKEDTIDSVANKFRVKPEELRRWNHLSSKIKLNPGQIITIYRLIP